jgi:hypothetical protein
MTLCRACREREPGDGVSTATALTGPAEGPTAALLLRVWQDAGPRARLLAVADAATPPASIGVAHGVDAICDAVRAWLLSL